MFPIGERLNRLLYGILVLESRLLRRINLPWGLGLLAILRRTDRAHHQETEARSELAACPT